MDWSGHDDALRSGHRTTRSLSIAPTRYAFRSFDRQWIIPDARLINQPNPTLWKAHSPRQVYLTAPEDRTPTAGPALTFTGLIPDLITIMDGEVAFIRSGAIAPRRTEPNIKPALLAYLGENLRAAGQGRGRDGLSRRRHGASGLHGALQGRSRPARPARSADGGCEAVRRSRRARLAK